MNDAIKSSRMSQAGIFYSDFNIISEKIRISLFIKNLLYFMNF